MEWLKKSLAVQLFFSGVVWADHPMCYWEEDHQLICSQELEDKPLSSLEDNRLLDLSEYDFLNSEELKTLEGSRLQAAFELAKDAYALSVDSQDPEKVTINHDKNLWALSLEDPDNFAPFFGSTPFGVRDSSGFVYYDEKTQAIYIALHGTNPLSAGDILTDLSFSQKPSQGVLGFDGKVHGGFLDRFESFKVSFDAAFETIQKRHPEAPVIVSGHSLGGL